MGHGLTDLTNTMFKRMIKSFRRIRQRTDLEKDAGSYWNLSDREERIRDRSHWRGVMRWNTDRWHTHGDFYLDLILKYLDRFAGAGYIRELHRKTALEWGCGGGSIVRPMCGKFSRVYGVEISEASIAECARQMESLGLSNFRGVFFPSHNPESIVGGIAPGSVDFIISANVFQHFPSKHYTGRVLKISGELLKPGGFALIQVRYFDGSEKLRQKEDDYAKNVIYMTSFAPGEFSSLLNESGFEILARERDIGEDDDHHDYYFVRKK